MAIFLGVYLCYVSALILAPFDFSLTAFANNSFAVRGRWNAGVLYHVLGFVPFGAILYGVTRSTAKNLFAMWGVTIGTAAAVGLALETGQLFLPGRSASVTDLLANMVGGGLGFGLAHYLDRRLWIAHLVPYRRRLAWLSLIGYVGGLSALLLWTTLPQGLDGWDPAYPFLIGNEATLNRPWLGKVFFVGLYDRAITAAEVLAQFQAGPSFDPAVHLAQRPVALYTFQEGGGRYVYDWSAVGPALDLEIAEPQRAGWLPGGGLELTRPTLLRSMQRPDKLYQHFTARHTFSVALWIQPKDARQRGPARIVSWSPDPGLRNFTLGQQASEVHFRVRTRLAGHNGTRGHLESEGLGLGPQLTHLVTVYARGTQTLYIDGVRFPAEVSGDILTVVAQVLKFDATSRWQRAFAVLMLLGPVGGLFRIARAAKGCHARP